MLAGTYVQSPTDDHVALRNALLAGQVLDRPGIPVPRISSGAFLGKVADLVLKPLSAYGLAIVQLDEILTSTQFLRFGWLLGEPMAELHPAVAAHVESGAILNLIAEHDKTEDVNLQPFARTFLSLHSEGSGRPAAEQPRYIVLMCCEPGDDPTSAQTAVVPMAAVAHVLTDREIYLLSRTRYSRNIDGPAICRIVDGRLAFSFRDFMAESLEWTSSAEDADADEVNAALRRLLAAAYAPDTASGMHWQRGMIFVLDNTFYFHARTSGSSGPVTRRRHLKRLRIVEPQRGAA